MNDEKNIVINAISKSFPIVSVGVGSSKHVLRDVEDFLKNIPFNSDMSFVFFLANKGFESNFHSLISEYSTIEAVSFNGNLTPNTISLVPPNYTLFFENEILELREIDDSDELSPLDQFFKSTALAFSEMSRGVLLSREGFEGITGLKFIKEQGGTTIVQQRLTKNDSIAADAFSDDLDFIKSPAEIPMQLMHLNSLDNLNSGAIATKPIQDDDEVYKLIILLLLQKTGNDFSHYKQPTIRRRIARRMVISKISDFKSYLDFLVNDDSELVALFNDILIPVTYFFRDSKVFSALYDSILPEIISKKTASETIRIWIAGCSTGEEAYSMAITVNELLLANKIPNKVQIFASDISENVIAKARTGIYSTDDVRNIPATTLSKNFIKVDGSYQIKKEIRDLCIFAVHNFVKDPPFAKLDLISCRNALIYLDTYLQKKAFNIFHYALLPSGTLLLGKSESTGHAPNLFKPSQKSINLFKKKNSVTTKVPISRERNEHKVATLKEKSMKKESSIPDFQKVADNILLSSYTPAGVIVNENKEIVHFHGNTGEFLLPPHGKPNFNVLTMAREGLSFEIRSALLDAKNSQKTVSKLAIPLKGMNYMADIEAIPVLSDNEDMHYLVLFKKSATLIGERKESEDEKTTEQKRIALLESEIEQLREDIRRVTEDQEAVNEELLSANEELLSNSEELQTLNEELETSAEQLQSNYEELQIVNEELTNRQKQLVSARLYAEAIIENIREPLLIIDANLSIRSANTSFYNNFFVSQGEIEGKMLFETFLGTESLLKIRPQIETSLAKMTNIDNIEIKVNINKSEKNMMLNVRPISSNNVGEPLALLAIADITEILAANKMLAHNNIELEKNNKQLASFSSVASHDLQEPLRKISLFSNLILDTEKNKISKESSSYLERIMASTTRMQQLINDLLLYSKVSSIKDSAFLKTDIPQVIKDACEDLEEQILTKHAEISIGEIPALKVISPLVRQVFTNLLSNSIKYCQAEVSPMIKITGALTTKLSDASFDFGNRTFLHLQYQDNGIGFAQQHASRIFEPFFRLHSKENYEGTGIGLAMCKKIMDLHSGHIECTSEQGKGAVFHLYFPVIA